MFLDCSFGTATFPAKPLHFLNEKRLSQWVVSGDTITCLQKECQSLFSAFVLEVSGAGVEKWVQRSAGMAAIPTGDVCDSTRSATHRKKTNSLQRQ
jgi:hypothetical protein